MQNKADIRKKMLFPDRILSKIKAALPPEDFSAFQKLVDGLPYHSLQLLIQSVIQSKSIQIK